MKFCEEVTWPVAHRGIDYILMAIWFCWWIPDHFPPGFFTVASQQVKNGFWGTWRGPKINRLDFGSDQVQYPEPRFLDLDQDPDRGIFSGFLITFLEGRAWRKERSIRFRKRFDLSTDPGTYYRTFCLLSRFILTAKNKTWQSLAKVYAFYLGMPLSFNLLNV